MTKRIVSQMHILDFAGIIGKISKQFYMSKDAPLGNLIVDSMPYETVQKMAREGSYTVRHAPPPQKIRELFQEAYRKVPGEFKRRSSDFVAEVSTSGGDHYAHFITDIYNKTVLEEILGFPNLDENLNEFMIRVWLNGRGDWRFFYGRYQSDLLENVFPEFERFVFRKLRDIGSVQRFRRPSGALDFIEDTEPEG